MDPTPTPTPTPSPTAAAVDVALSNYWLAISLLIATVVVIILALAFAWIYHQRALKTIEYLGSTASAGSIGVENQEALESLVAPKRVVGSIDGQKDVGLMYIVKGWRDGDTIKWEIPEADTEIVDDRTIIAKFRKDGTHTVTATVTDASGASEKLPPLSVSIKPQAAAAPAIVIPFVVKNWGRLVIVLFGVGVIAALMATKVLDSAAGVGILGTLLGAGAVAASTGSAGESTSSKPTPESGDPSSKPAG